MELSEEGLAVAAATRQALAQRKRQLEEAAVKVENGNGSSAAAAPTGVVNVNGQPQPPAVKKAHLARPAPMCTHEVALPEGFDKDSIKLPVEIYGAACMGLGAGAWAGGAGMQAVGFTGRAAVRRWVLAGRALPSSLTQGCS